MKLTHRQTKLLELLTKQEGTKTISDYATLMQVSNRTLYSDLNSVEPYIDTLGYKLERIPGKGVEVNRKKQEHFPKEIDNINIDRIMSPSERQKDIMIQLLFGNQTLTYEIMSKQYNVSISSLQNDLKIIKKRYTNKSTAKIVSDFSGTRLAGDEEEWRSTFVLFNEVSVLNTDAYGAKINWYGFLTKMYREDIVKSCSNIIDEFEKTGIFIVSQNYISNVLNILVVMTYRTKYCFHLKDNKRNLVVNEIMEISHLLLSKDILSRLEKELSIHFKENDYSYFAKYLVANRIHFKRTVHKKNDMVVNLTKKIIEKMTEYLGIVLTDDETLFTQLLTHIQPMLYRLTNGIYIKNSLLNDIKTEFRIVFDVLWMALDEVFEEINTKLTEDEVGFLLIYFQTALDKKQRSKRVLLVCPTGISTSRFVINRIRNTLPPLDIVESSSIDIMMNSNLEQIDFIISTVPLEYREKPVIVVSPLPTEEDIKNISRFYSKNFVIQNNIQHDYNFEVLPKYLTNELVTIDDSFSNKGEIIDYMCGLLEEKNYVSRDYRQSVHEREKMGSTSMVSGASIPHGKSKFVYRSSVSLYISKKTIKWDTYNVKVIAMIVIKDDEKGLIKTLVKDVFELLNTKQKIDSLSKCEDNISVMKYIKGGLV